MRNPERIDIVLEVLRTYWKKHPDLRLGQIVSNTNSKARSRFSDIFFLEDEEFLEQLNKDNENE